MALKQDFLDMLHLIAPNINEESYEEDYTVEQDFYMDICDMSGKDITYDGCEYCENCNDRNVCNHKISKKVDIYLWCASDESTAYIFNGKLEKPILVNSIHTINSRNQLLTEMTKLKEQFDYDKNAYAEYAKRLEEYKRYISEFVDTITEEFSIFSAISKDIIPVVFCPDFRKDHDWNGKTVTKGDCDFQGVQSIIRIYNSWNDDLDDMKCTIRHEIIHYLLWCLNPLGIWYRDNFWVFHYFCDVYGANAYEEMDDYNKWAYEKMEKCNKQQVNDFLQKCLDSKRSEDD